MADQIQVPVSSVKGSGSTLVDAERDELATFRSAVMGIRGVTTSISVVLAGTEFTSGDLWIVGWCIVVAAYNVLRIVQPVRYTNDRASNARLVVELGIHLAAIVATGYWYSPFVFSLITAVMITGFARGFAFGLRNSVMASAVVAAPFLVGSRALEADIRTTIQWTAELVLVALIAGYARRITGEADRQHTLALDRLGRLADANLLLYSLHRVAQTLPASLDLEEALDTTLSRLRELFDSDGITILLFDETSESWQVARFEGPRPAAGYAMPELPEALLEAISMRSAVRVDHLIRPGHGMSAEMSSGLYAILPARDSVVGLIALEHRTTSHFRERDRELLEGFVEPAALAIDNARWFSRLRTVGADEERTRIARDLHDRIGQSLAYLAFELDRIVKTDAKGAPVTEALEQLRGDVRGVVGEVRDTLYDLRTDVTDTQDISATIQQFLDRVANRSSLEAKLDARVTGRLPLLQERELWRIAQEAITNVERHAAASKVVVTWKTDGSRALLMVVDDGIGFPEGRAGRLDSYGVVGMRERAASIGATLDVAGTEGVGTTVRCEIQPTA